MARKGLSKQQIFTTAKELAANGELPTAIKIRNLLTTGSIATIQKYLKEWKTNCFNFNKDLINDLNSTPTNQELLDSQRILERSLSQQIAKNENYTQELIQAEKTIATLKAENYKLQTINKELQLELKEATAIKTTLEQVTQKIQHRLELNDHQTIIQQQQLIESLQVELKELSAKSMKAMQELSSADHEALMQERVHSINLQAKIDALNKELMDSNKQLESIKQTAEFQVKVLQRQIKAQQQVLTNYLAPEELNNLNLEGLLIGANCGK